MEEKCKKIIQISFDKNRQSLRDFLELCINNLVIISAHNRTFGWDEENCISYLNNAFRKVPHIGHPISVFVNYFGESLRGVYFDSEPNTVVDIKLLKNKDIPLIEDFEGKYVMKDGRHKIQNFIWLVAGKKIKLNSFQKRFFIRLKIVKENERDISLILEDDNRIHLLDNQKNIFYEEQNGCEYIYILFKLCDDVWYKKINSFKDKDIKQEISTIKYSNLSDVLYTTIVENKDSVEILYGSLPSISDMISFQIDDIRDIPDEYTLAEIIRSIQLGVPWDELDILETWAEFNIGDQNFRRKSLKLYREFQDRKLLVGAGSDASHLLYAYTTINASGIGKGDLGKAVNCSPNGKSDILEKKKKLQLVVENFDDISDFLNKWFSYIEKINKYFIHKDYFQFLHFIGPWLFRKDYSSLLTTYSPGNYNPQMVYIIKLLYRVMFKFFPDQKKIFSKNSWDVISKVIKKLSTFESVGNNEYQQIESLINEASDGLFKQPINHLDLTNNFKLTWVIYDRWIDDFNKDIDHDLSKHEAKNFPWRDQIIKEIYLTTYQDSYLNLLPLYEIENRKNKRELTQFQWYELKPELMSKRYIDPSFIGADITPYDRIRAHKVLKDQALIRYFSQFQFTRQDFDFTMP